MTSAAHTHLALGPAASGSLAEPTGPDKDSTEIVHLGPGDSWSAPEAGQDLQVLVASGTLELGDTTLSAGGFARWADGEAPRLLSKDGATLLIKRRPVRELQAHEAPHVLVDPNAAQWAPGHGNLKVLPLDTRDTENTALVLWPAGERFLPHRHLGGEEIFVLSGTFHDEHGQYPAGSWIQSPHGSVHHPFVEEQTLIWVKTGHLAP